MTRSDPFEGNNLRTLAGITVAGTLVFGLALLFHPFLISLLLGGVFASISRPLFNQIQRFTKLSGLSALLTILIVVILLLLPLGGLVTLLIHELTALRSAVQTGNYSLQPLNDLSNHFTSLLGIAPIQIDSHDYIVKILSLIADKSTWILGGVIGVLGTSFLALISAFYILQSQSKFRDAVVKFSPLNKKDTTLIIERTHEVIRASVSGNLLLMIIQGVAAIIDFSIFGVSTPILLGILYGLTSVIPSVGSALIWVPVVLYEVLQGQYLAAIGITLWSLAQVVVFDHYVGPRLIEKRANLHPFLILLGILGGVVQFGIVGVILGPTVVALGMVGLEILTRFWQVQPD